MKQISANLTELITNPLTPLPLLRDALTLIRDHVTLLFAYVRCRHPLLPFSDPNSTL